MSSVDISNFKNIKSAMTNGQLQMTYEYVDDIIGNLDQDAIGELMSGNSNDIDEILNLLFEETSKIISFDDGKIKTGTFGYLEKFTDSVEESFRTYSFNYFIQSVLYDFEINWHHLEWGSLVQKYNRLCVLAARDHGKSFFFSFAYVLWMLYKYDKYNTSSFNMSKYSRFGMLVTNEFNLAKHLLSLVKAEIEDNFILREKLFPGTKEGTWAETEIKCKNGSMFIVKSFGSKMRGFHPTFMIADDYLNDSVIYSEDQNKKYINHFFSVMANMIVPGGPLTVVGTPYTTTDLYSKLKESDDWKVFEYPGIFPNGSLLWSNRHSLKSLLSKKETQGSIIFSREILVRPISSDSTIFPWTILEKSFIGMSDYKLSQNIWSFNKKFVKVVIGCDFAISANVGADYSVFTVLGIDELDNYWVLYVWREKGKSYSEQLAVLKKLNADFSPSTILVETNQMQVIFFQGAKESGLPVVDHHTGENKYDFKKGLPALSTLFEMNRIKLPRGDSYSRDVTDTICIELSSITWNKGKLTSVSKHDDCGMSLWLAVCGANYINKSFSFSFI